MNMETSERSDAELLERFRQVEARLLRLEQYLGMSTQTPAGAVAPSGTAGTGVDDGSLEEQISQYWLARFGAIFLLLSIGFFILYPFPALPVLLTSLWGYGAVALVYLFARSREKTYPYLSKLLHGGILILLYLATLRLHFFHPMPLLADKTIGLLLLVLLVSVLMYYAVTRRSQSLTILVLALFNVTALISDQPYFCLSLTTTAAILTVTLLFHRTWPWMAFAGLAMTYLTLLLWLLNNPVMGHAVQATAAHHHNLVYLAIIGTAFAAANIYRDKDAYSNIFEIGFSVLNGLGIYLIGGLNILFFFRNWTSLLATATAVFFLLVAILNWKRTRSTFSTSLYACFGYVAMSVAIITGFKSPDYFIWLGLQSWLVIVTALWFRSQLIVIANIIMYLLIFMLYLPLVPSNTSVNISYAVSALASARLLNWQRERLKLKTDLIRNIYLACAFLIVLYGLVHAVRPEYISLSWLLAAVFYFIVSLALKNIKYRWMAILTVLATIGRVITVDLANMAAGLRIILLLTVSLVLIFWSIFYARYKSRIKAADRQKAL